jgi:hypothetical protein
VAQGGGRTVGPRDEATYAVGLRDNVARGGEWGPYIEAHRGAELWAATVWHPRFLITVINANDRINRVKPVKPRSNLGQPGSSPENLANEP